MLSRLLNNQDDPEGILVCLQCFNGGCFGEGRRHAYLHYQKSKHGLGVVVKRTRKEQKKRVSLQSISKIPWMCLFTVNADHKGIVRAADEEACHQCAIG